jgi:rhomboid-like protein
MQEATSVWHFLAFYSSAGLFSGLVSHIFSARFRYPRLISQLSANAAANVTSVTLKAKPAVLDIIPSLGASGAIYAAVTLTALGFPDTQIALLIPPSFPIPIQYGVGGLIAIDIIGALRGWRMFDHYAHLGGAAFGAFYYAYGPRFWDTMRLSYSSPAELQK